jgi:endoglucanase
MSSGAERAFALRFSRSPAEIQQVAAWAKKRNVRVMCNELGVYRRVTTASDRVRWIGDVRTALEMHGIGWTMWDYAGDFGLVTKQSDQIVVDELILSALGLGSDPNR